MIKWLFRGHEKQKKKPWINKIKIKAEESPVLNIYRASSISDALTAAWHHLLYRVLSWAWTLSGIDCRMFSRDEHYHRGIIVFYCRLQWKEKQHLRRVREATSAAWQLGGVTVLVGLPELTSARGKILEDFYVRFFFFFFTSRALITIS